MPPTEMRTYKMKRAPGTGSSFCSLVLAVTVATTIGLSGFSVEARAQVTLDAPPESSGEVRAAQAMEAAPDAAHCGTGKVAASEAFTDQHLYDAMVDAFSMRGFVASTGVSGHDHFFDSFEKIRAISDS